MRPGANRRVHGGQLGARNARIARASMRPGANRRVHPATVRGQVGRPAGCGLAGRAHGPAVAARRRATALRRCRHRPCHHRHATTGRQRQRGAGGRQGGRPRAATLPTVRAGRGSGRRHRGAGPGRHVRARGRVAHRLRTARPGCRPGNGAAGQPRRPVGRAAFRLRYGLRGPFGLAHTTRVSPSARVRGASASAMRRPPPVSRGGLGVCRPGPQRRHDQPRYRRIPRQGQGRAGRQRRCAASLPGWRGRRGRDCGPSSDAPPPATAVSSRPAVAG